MAEIPYEELWDIRERSRLQLSDKHMFSSVIFYWVFKDSVIFKTTHK